MFGVGTDLAVSRDVPALGVVYKLVEAEYDGHIEYKTKFSTQKGHWPGRKQVFRFSRAALEATGNQELFHHDLIARAGEDYPEAMPLLETVMRAGRRAGARLPLAEIRARTLSNLQRLPRRYQSLHDGPRYPVATSAALERLLEEVREHYAVAPDVAKAGRVPSEPGADETLAFLDVDSQVDFMDPRGALYVPGAETIIPNLRRLMDHARRHRIPVFSSADAHSPEDPSFAKWPPHCVVGTPGQHRIPETQFSSATVIPNRPGAFAPPSDWCGQFVVEKTDYSVAGNPNFDSILAALGPCHFVAFGVATEYCVVNSVLALRQLNIPVDLVTDAVKAITEEGGRKALEQMVAAGTRLVTTEQVCSGANQLKTAVVTKD